MTRPRGTAPSSVVPPRADEGFSIIEVIVSVVLLGFVAIAILPALLTGLTIASDQASTATAMRTANAVIEQARENPSCAGIASALSARTVEDGGGRTLVVSGTAGSCIPGQTVPVTVTVTSEGGDEEYASVRALILAR